MVGFGLARRRRATSARLPVEPVVADRASRIILIGARIEAHGVDIMIRRLLFILFLYILLVWLIAVYLYSSDSRRLVDEGLLWTAIGVGALLLWLILERVIGWWRMRRAPETAQALGTHPSAQPR